GDDGAAGGRGELAPARGAEDDLLAVEEVGHRLGRRHGGIGENDAADLARGEQAEALGLVELHQFDDGRSVRGCHCGSPSWRSTIDDPLCRGPLTGSKVPAGRAGRSPSARSIPPRAGRRRGPPGRRSTRRGPRPAAAPPPGVVEGIERGVAHPGRRSPGVGPLDAPAPAGPPVLLGADPRHVEAWRARRSVRICDGVVRSFPHGFASSAGRNRGTAASPDTARSPRRHRACSAAAGAAAAGGPAPRGRPALPAAAPAGDAGGVDERNRGPVRRSWVVAWFGMLALALVNGTLRAVVTQPLLGETAARALATVFLLAALTGYVWWLHRRRPIPTARQAWAIGLAWVAMTLAFEFGWGRAVEGLAWPALLADCDVTAGRIWVLVPVWTALAPVVVRRAQAAHRPGGASRGGATGGGAVTRGAWPR